MISENKSTEPRLVIRGETTNNLSEEKTTAFIDWFGFTMRPDHSQTNAIHILRTALTEIFNLPVEAWIETEKGWNGYDHRINLGTYGLLAFGGQYQRGTIHVDINGQGCSLVKNWKNVIRWGLDNNIQITRTDTAHDDLKGNKVDLAKAQDWFHEGGFTTSGRPPTPKLISDLFTGGGSTLYIGKRENGKLLRIYEKGKQLGDPTSPWVRVEVEFHNKDRTIPWDILTEPGKYLAGAYPCLAYLNTEQDKIKTLNTATTISYLSMKKWLHTAAGKSLNAMLLVHQGDATGVLTELVRDGLPKRLEPFDKYLSSNFLENTPVGRGGKS